MSMRVLPLAAAILVLLGTQSAAVEAKRYPNCPLTGKPPVKTTFPTRCLDATAYTCCEQCQDIRQALGLVSANFSDVVQWSGFPPDALEMFNNVLNGTDSNLCTPLARIGPSSGTDGHFCSLRMEQLACAMSCHPSGGDFITKIREDLYQLEVCQNYYFKFAADCRYLPIPGDVGTIGQFLPPNMPQLLYDFGNIAWGLSGLPEFQVIISNRTDPPGCYGGIPDDANSVLAYPCCDALDTTGCPASVLEYGKHPYFSKFANNQNASVSCRLGKDFKGKKVVAFSPPPSRPPSLSPPPRPKSPPPDAPPASSNSPAPALPGGSGGGTGGMAPPSAPSGQGLGAQSLPPPNGGFASKRRAPCLGTFLVVAMGLLLF